MCVPAQGSEGPAGALGTYSGAQICHPSFPPVFGTFSWGYRQDLFLEEQVPLGNPRLTDGAITMMAGGGRAWRRWWARYVQDFTPE